MADSRLPARPLRLPVIDTGRCTACGRCVAVCRLHLLSLEAVQWRKSAVLHDRDRCTGCRDCAVTCPFHAITMHRPAPAGGTGGDTGGDTAGGLPGA